MGSLPRGSQLPTDHRGAGLASPKTSFPAGISEYDSIHK